tara:strand:- start:1351 stop:2679 length:1329 start_codon:yes stop_codon:yes gene_type:complete
MEYVYFLSISLAIITLYLVFSFYKQYNLKESFKASNPKKDCTGKVYIDECSKAEDNCEDYWSYVPNKGPTGKDMKNARMAMGCNYSGGGGDEAKAGCSYKTNSAMNKVNDNWLCKDGTYNEEEEEDEQPEEEEEEEEEDEQPDPQEEEVCRKGNATQFSGLVLTNGNSNQNNDTYTYIHDQSECEYKGCLDPNATNAIAKPTNFTGKIINNKHNCDYPPTREEVCKEDMGQQFARNLEDDLDLPQGAIELQNGCSTSDCVESENKTYEHKQSKCKYKACSNEYSTIVTNWESNDSGLLEEAQSNSNLCISRQQKTVTHTPKVDDIDQSTSNNWNEKCKTQWGSPDAWEGACESVTDAEQCKTGNMWVLDKNGRPYLCKWNSENEKCMNKESCFLGTVNLDYRNGLKSVHIGGTSVFNGCDNFEDEDEKLRCQLALSQEKMHI